MGKTSLTHEIYLNGQMLDIVTGFEWEEYPSHLYQVLEDVSTVHDRSIKLSSYMKGRANVTLSAPAGRNSNDPMSMEDLFGFKSTYATYNTATGVIENSSTVYDWNPGTDGTLDKPLVPHEIRQTLADTETSVDSDGDCSKVAQKFRAFCTDLTTLKLKLRDADGAEVSAVSFEIWTDDSGPDSQLTNSATVDSTGLTITNGSDYEDATWVSIDISSIMGTAHLTPGTDYWLVIEAAETDPLYINKTDSNQYTPGGLQAYTGSWGSLDGDLTFILIGTDSYGGHNVIIYDYTESKSAYVKYTCYGCNVILKNVEIDPKKHLSATLKIFSERIERTKG